MANLGINRTPLFPCNMADMITLVEPVQNNLIYLTIMKQEEVKKILKKFTVSISQEKVSLR